MKRWAVAAGCGALAMGAIAQQAVDGPESLRRIIEGLKVARLIDDAGLRLKAYDDLADAWLATSIGGASAALPVQLDLDVSRDPTALAFKADCAMRVDPYKGTRALESLTWPSGRAECYFSRAFGDQGAYADFLMVLFQTTGRVPGFAEAGDLTASALGVTRLGPALGDSPSLLTFTYAIALPEGYLEAHAPNGIDIKMWGGSDEVFVRCAPSYAFGFLSRCADEAKASSP